MLGTDQILSIYLALNLFETNYHNPLFTNYCSTRILFQVLLIDDLADTCFTLLNAVTQLVRVGGARAVYVFVTHAVMSQMPQVIIITSVPH